MAINFLEETAIKPISLFFFIFCFAAHGLKALGDSADSQPHQAMACG